MTLPFLRFAVLTLVAFLALSLGACWLAVRLADVSNAKLDRLIAYAVLPVLAALFAFLVFGLSL